jgi:SAM-dependent methyltransferase
MHVTEAIKQSIISEYISFRDLMYSGKTKEERQELDQFFTPPDLTIQLLEQLEGCTLVNKTILDPTSGSGNLLAACLIAGADSDKVFGNEYDPVMVQACRERLNKVCDLLGKPRINDWQIHRGDATDSFCLTYFGPDYKQKLEEHFLDGQYSLFPMLTKEQEEFLMDVD